MEIQEIEFHLIILITELDLASSMEPDFVRVKKIKNSKKEPFDMTLGELRESLDNFNTAFLTKLQLTLKELNKLRRRYAHHLFSGMDNWEKVIKDVKRGLELNELTLSELSKISKVINEQSEFGKIMNKKVKR